MVGGWLRAAPALAGAGYGRDTCGRPPPLKFWPILAVRFRFPELLVTDSGAVRASGGAATASAAFCGACSRPAREEARYRRHARCNAGGAYQDTRVFRSHAGSARAIVSDGLRILRIASSPVLVSAL